MKRTLLLIFPGIFWLAASDLLSPLRASAAVPATPRAIAPGSLRSIDTIPQDIPKVLSKRLQLLKSAEKAIKSKNFSQALKLGNQIQKDPSYSDYGYWFSATALQAEASEAIKQKKNDAGIMHAKKAIPLLLQIESTFPYSPLIKMLPRFLAKSDLLIADGSWGLKKWQTSRESFERAFQRLQSQNLLFSIPASSLGHYAQSCQKSSGPLCIGWLQKFASIHAKKSQEMAMITKYYPSLPEKIKGSRSYNRFTTTYKAPDLDQVAIDEAMKLYLAGKGGDAISALRKFLDEFPRSTHRFRAQYWLAQALIQDKKQEEATKVYEQLQADSPLSYYGLLASLGTKKSLELSIDATLPMAMDDDPLLQPQDLIRLKRAKELLAQNAYSLASWELKEIGSIVNLSSPFLVYLAMLNSKAKNIRLSFKIVGELIQRGYEGIVSSYGLKMIFPENYVDIIRKNAQINSLDPILVLSLVKQESAFEEEASSGVGAMGLMQLMPGTAADVDAEINTSQLFAAEDNVRIGTTYLRKLMIRFNGNMVLALAAYNAGPHAVDRWLKDFPPEKGMLEFIESIPYRETREYVGAIIRNYYWYARNTNETAPQNLDFFWKADIRKPPTKTPTFRFTKRRNGNA